VQFYARFQSFTEKNSLHVVRYAAVFITYILLYRHGIKDKLLPDQKFGLLELFHKHFI